MDTSLRERALRLLARREHSRVELARKLASHAESAEALDVVLDDLVTRRLLSDARYVEMRLNTRASRFGNARLSQELKMQGVDNELLDAALSQCENELVRAREVWQRKFGARPVSDDAAGRAKQMRFLMSRGFSGETIRRVLRGDFSDD